MTIRTEIRIIMALNCIAALVFGVAALHYYFELGWLAAVPAALGFVVFAGIDAMILWGIAKR